MPAPRARSSTEISCSGRSSSSCSAVARIAARGRRRVARRTRRPRAAGASLGARAGHGRRSYTPSTVTNVTLTLLNSTVDNLPVTVSTGGGAPVSTPSLPQAPSTTANVVRLPSGPLEHVDVLIVGAGLSGIGAACHLRTKSPDKTFAILEAPRRDRRHVGPVPLSRASGRTPTCSRWATPSGRGRRRRRSPTARRSCRYVRETAREYDVDRHIRFHHRVVRAEWSTARRALDGRGRAHRHGRDGAPDLRLPVHVHRLLPLRRGLHAARSRAPSASPARSCTRSTGPRTSTTPASAWS